MSSRRLFLFWWGDDGGDDGNDDDVLLGLTVAGTGCCVWLLATKAGGSFALSVGVFFCCCSFVEADDGGDSVVLFWIGHLPAACDGWSHWRHVGGCPS